MAEHPKQADSVIDTSATRRSFLKQGAALGVGASLMSMVPPGVRSAAWAAGSDAPEKKEVRIGFIPLTDCSSVVMAAVEKFDEKYGIKIIPSKEASWAAVRDKLVNGELDAAHVLYGLVYGVHMGIGGPKKDMANLMTLNNNGQAITLANKLKDQGVTDGASLQFTGLPFFAPELFMTVILKNPLRTKQLQQGLAQLGEEGAIQVFKPDAGGAMLLGAVGQLQFEVVQHRLKAEYDADVRLEGCQYTGARWITGGRVAGTAGGLWVLAALSAGQLSLFVGASTVAAALVTLLMPAFSPGRGAFVGAGLVTGITETATGIGGPPLALVYQHQPAPTMRSTIALCFLLGELVSLAVLLATGRVGLPQLQAAALLLPALVVGAVLSRLVHRRVNGRLLRIFVQVFAIVSGLVLLVKAF